MTIPFSNLQKELYLFRADGLDLQRGHFKKGQYE